MIPKTIHYCWFGGNEMPKKMKQCLSSWKKICPEYEVIEWNEHNFDVSSDPYLQWCWENRKWAYLSDLARLMIVYQYGGIYLDTDVELVRSLDSLLSDEAYFFFEDNSFINTGLGFGAEAKNGCVKKMIDEYRIRFSKGLDQKSLINCPYLNSQALKALGFEMNGQKQQKNGITLYPTDVANPYDYLTGTMNQTEDTISIHWFAGSAVPRVLTLRSKLLKPVRKVLRNTRFRKNK